MVVENWKFAQSLTKKPVKAVITGPYTLGTWSLDEHYDTRRDFVLDLMPVAHAGRGAGSAAAAGARLRPDRQSRAIAFSGQEDMPLVAEALRIVTRDVDAHTILHVCLGSFQPVLGAMFDLPVDQLDLSLSGSAERMLPRIKRLRTRKLLGVGLVDAHLSRVETPEEIAAGLGFALNAMPAEQLFVTADCGLKTRSVAEARSKVRSLVEAVARVRDARRIGGELPTRDPSGRPWPGPLHAARSRLRRPPHRPGSATVHFGRRPNPCVPTLRTRWSAVPASTSLSPPSVRDAAVAYRPFPQ